MTDLDVRIVKLEPMQVASSYGFGASPEAEAWDKLLAWARPRGLLDNLNSVRFFGFNNPNPSPGSPNYGYEQWITVGPDAVPEGDIRIETFDGGLYAVTRCKLPQITDMWQRLVAWCEESHYKWGYHQCLEESLTPPGTPFDEVIMDIYMPIAE